MNEEEQDIGYGRNRYFSSEENKSTVTEKEDGKAGKKEMIAQQRVSRRADLRATNEKFHCTFISSVCLSVTLPRRWF